MQDWSNWIGREVRAQDRLDPALATRWCATFDLVLPADGTMPQGIHLCLCTPETRTGQLGGDGHPQRRGDDESFLPPIPLPRRMWASSAMQFHAPIAVGATIERLSTIVGIEAKSGSRGDMVFVEVDHETSADGQLAVRERQTLVYLAALAEDAPLAPPETGSDGFDPAGWHLQRVIVPDETLLFRYSALTFNSHRIHYDAPYAREIERYRGLVVHGPLTASLMLQLAAERFGENRLSHFRFRGVSPAIVNEPLNLVIRGEGETIELGAYANDGRQITAATATLDQAAE
ncbi:MAG: hypothetical protein DI637_12180 [Citromicrobium sp.]|nr:MAG: hypothetical protein DI637_12180 [Citromicrobium sp.]